MKTTPKPSREAYEKHWLLCDIQKIMNGQWSTQEERDKLIEKARVASGISDEDMSFFKQEQERYHKEREESAPKAQIQDQSSSCTHCNGTRLITTTRSYTNNHSGYTEHFTSISPCPHC